MREAAGLGILALVLIAIMAVIMSVSNVKTELISPSQCWDKGGFWSKGVCYIQEDN